VKISYLWDAINHHILDTVIAVVHTRASFSAGITTHSLTRRA
jgi:hypothetical protein